MRARTTKRDARSAWRFCTGHPTAPVCACPTGHSSTSRLSSPPGISSWGRRLRGTRSSTTCLSTRSARRDEFSGCQPVAHCCPSSDSAAELLATGLPSRLPAARAYIGRGEAEPRLPRASTAGPEADEEGVGHPRGIVYPKTRLSGTAAPFHAERATAAVASVSTDYVP